MPSAKRQRKFIVFLCLGLAGVILTVLCFPIWLPWVLRPIATKYGLHYSKYVRNGYGRLILQEVTFTNSHLRLKVSNLDSALLIKWLQRSGFRQNQDPIVKVKGWHLEILSSSSGTGRQASVTEIVQQTRAIFQSAGKWIPRATFSEGLVEFPDGKIHLPAAHWTGTQLELTNAALLIPQLKRLGDWVSMGELTNISLLAIPDDRQPWRIEAKIPPLELASSIRISTNELGVALQSTVFWKSNQITFDAQFGREGIIPTKVSLRAPELELSSDQLRGYSRLSGAIDAKWENSQFSVDLKANGMAAESATNMPPFKADLHISGDTNVAIFHSVNASLPWFEAQLSKDFRFFFHGQHVRDQAEATLRIDFNKQPWVSLEGVLTGNALLSPGTQRFPEVRFKDEWFRSWPQRDKSISS
jgi:hypothetical protein